jgi:amino acid transporter
MELVICFFLYLIFLIISILGGKVFWTTNKVLAILCLVLITIYILGSATHSNFERWGSQNVPLRPFRIMKSMPASSLNYLGIQYLPLTCKFTQDPKKDIPNLMGISITALVLISITILTLAFSQSPGPIALMDEPYPLAHGFQNIFHFSNRSDSVWMCFMGLFAPCLTFLYCFGRQVTCMAGSGLLPAVLKKHIPIVHTPYMALIAVTVVTFLMNILLFFDDEKRLRDAFVLICALSSFIVFITFFIAYIQFKMTHSSLTRVYTSPFGVVGGYVGIFIFLTGVVASVGFQGSDWLPGVFIGSASLLIIVYFVLFLRGNKEFSEEEKDALFKAYLVNGEWFLFFQNIYLF